MKQMKFIKKFFNKTSYVWVILISILIGMLLKTYVFVFAHVSGYSMFPTFHDKQLVLIDKLYKNFKRGDIIVFNSHDPSDNIYVKRIIGLPGDSVVIKNSEVYVNGKKIDEDYLPKNTHTEGKTDLKVPPNQYFVLGDNRTNSKDSRFIGTIDKSDIIGKVGNK